MTLVHIHRANPQPATCFKVPEIEFAFECSHRSPRWATCCNRNRWAGNLVAHAYYDTVLFFCKKGKGCKLKEEP